MSLMAVNWPRSGLFSQFGSFSRDSQLLEDTGNRVDLRKNIRYDLWE